MGYEIELNPGTMEVLPERKTNLCQPIPEETPKNLFTYKAK